MNSYFEQSGFYGQGGAPAAGDYRFPIGLGGLGGVSPYSQHQPRPPQDSAYDATPGSPSKAGSLYSSLGDSAAYRWVDMCADMQKDNFFTQTWFEPIIFYPKK